MTQAPTLTDKQMDVLRANRDYVINRIKEEERTAEFHQNNTASWRRELIAIGGQIMKVKGILR